MRAYDERGEPNELLVVRWVGCSMQRRWEADKSGDGGR